MLLLLLLTALSFGTIVTLLRYYQPVLIGVYDFYLDYKYTGFRCDTVEPTMVINVDKIVTHPIDSCIRYVYYCHNQDDYILPWNTNQTPQPPLPLYDPEDLMTCMKFEYSSITIGQRDVSTVVRKYAGPKGNFYCDTPYQFKLDLIVDENGLPIVTEGETLSLVTIFGVTYTFNREQLLIINGLC